MFYLIKVMEILLHDLYLKDKINYEESTKGVMDNEKSTYM